MSTDRVLVGRIVRPHGLGGAMVVELATDRPEERFRPGAVVQTEDGSPLTVKRYEATDRSPLLTFEGVDGRESAQALRDTLLYIAADQRRPLDEDEFWPDELLGMEVVFSDGSPMGRVADVHTGAGQDRLVVETAAGRVMVPFVADLVPAVDPDRRRITVRLPEGLLD